MASAAYYEQPQGPGGFQLGGSAFRHTSHANHASVERHYDELREQARQCHNQGNYEGMRHANQQASDYILLENNAPDRVRGDEIDLHGQFVHEAEGILRKRLKEMQNQHQPVLHVIVGKGNHSPGHIQKIKPAVEQLCREMGLREETEPNEGRIKIYLRDGGGGGSGGQYHQPHGQPHYEQQPPGGAGHHGKPQEQFQSEDEKLEQDLIKKCIKSCCTVM